MRKEKLNTLLDSIYELEGLVHLAITRDDEPAMLPELIRRKSRELMAHAEKATTAEESPAAATPEPSEPEPPTQEYADAPEEYEVLEEETAPVLSIFQSVPDVEPESEPERVAESEPEPESEVISEIEIKAKPEAKVEAEPTPEPKPKAASQKESYKFQEYTEPRGRLVFSINDRYRFKRELFHGSDNDFNTTLSRVASMEGYDEAEDYFLNDLQWDEKSPDVIDFLEILKNYFK